MRMPVRKSQPELGTVHVDQMLTSFSVAYIQSQSVFIATQIFPIVGVDKQSDKYYTFTKNDWFRDEAQKRAENTESAGSGYTLSSDSYFAEVWGFHKDLGYQTAANADRQLNMERGAVQFVTQRLLLRQEIQFTYDYFRAGIWGIDWAGVAGAPGLNQVRHWSDYVNSDPIEDVENIKETMLRTTGFKPNTIAMGYQVNRRLKRHPDIIDMIKPGTAEGVKQVTDAQLATIFGVDRVFVPQAIKATNNENETAAYDFVHGKSFWIGYVNPTPEPMMPSAGYTFGWNGISAGLGQSIAIDSFYIREKKTTRYEGEIAFGNKVVAADLGAFITTVVA